jgi:hypothetical protein
LDMATHYIRMLRVWSILKANVQYSNCHVGYMCSLFSMKYPLLYGNRIFKWHTLFPKTRPRRTSHSGITIIPGARKAYHQELC